MPELPEVETTRCGIAPWLEGQQIQTVIVRDRRLRWPVPEDIEDKLSGQTLRDLRRRAKYLLFDTDIGSDIDDAVCLAYLLANPHCELLGITTVTGNGRDRGRLASALCRAAGKEIPIYLGAETPLLVEQRRRCRDRSRGAVLVRCPGLCLPIKRAHRAI